jgi:hypothetical protein
MKSLDLVCSNETVPADQIEINSQTESSSIISRINEVKLIHLSEDWDNHHVNYVTKYDKSGGPKPKPELKPSIPLTATESKIPFAAIAD